MTAFTKWCPVENGVKTFEQAEAAVDLALMRMNQKQLSLMQCKYFSQLSEKANANKFADHIWDYTDDSYLHNLNHLRRMQNQGKIGYIGLTNTDASHLQLLVNSGFNIATLQVSCSVIDRRLVRGRLASVCINHKVGVLAYGVLLGGFLNEKWLGAAEPQDLERLNWSLRKYLRFINAAGGWDAYQAVLQALSIVSKKHGVPIAAVAIRHVLDLPPVSAVIVGSRLSSSSEKYTKDSLSAFSFSLDTDDRAVIAKAQESLTNISGDCGDEYRRPPYLTATGDLSHHLTENEQDNKIAQAITLGSRIEYSSSSRWEPIAVSPEPTHRNESFK